jgi:hypothetical protein
MSRLTKEIREQMARKLVAHRYTDEAKELVRLNRELADAAYNHCYPKGILTHMHAVHKVFPDAFSLRQEVRVNAGGYNLGLGWQMDIRWVSVQQAKHDGYLQATHRHNITDDKLVERIKAFADRKRAFDEVCKTAYHEALSVLNTMTTGKKLAEAWPEAIPVIGDLIPEDQRTLPVVQVSAINAKFKLPPETKA